MANDAPPAGPDFCGGSVTVTWTVTDSCAAPVTCSAQFTVPPPTPPTITCPPDTTVAECLTQAQIDAAFTAWVAAADATFSGGCFGTMANDAPPAGPDFCGGSVTVTWTVTDSCAAPVTCSAIFTVPPPTPPTITCPPDTTVAECLTQAQIDAAFTAWVAAADATFSGGCFGTMANDAPPAGPDFCGGSVTVTWTVTDSCAAPVTCSAQFTVPPPTPPTITCPPDTTVAECLTQAQIDAAFTAWVAAADATFSGGCFGTMANDAPPAGPDFCGGSVTVTWTVTDSCAAPVTCSAQFNVPPPTPPTITCPPDTTVAECLTQAQIDAAFTAWVAAADATFSGGCFGTMANDAPPAGPDFCGGSVTVTWTVTDSCAAPVTCSAQFTVPPPTPPTITCPPDTTVAECLTQAQIDAAFTAWVAAADATFSGGCFGTMANDAPPAGPDFCGGSVTVTWTVTDSCAAPVTCSAQFTVPPPTPPTITCPPDTTVAECLTQAQIDAAFTAWVAAADATFSGGCFGTMANDAPPAGPDFCGGSVTVTWTVTDSCAAPVTCSAIFTVPPPTPPTITCPPDTTVAECLTQAQIDAAFTAWVAAADATFSGGCFGTMANDAPPAGPDFCGGSVTVTWTVTDSCAAPVTCSAHIHTARRQYRRQLLVHRILLWQNA